jgi:hypothetical protein
MLLRKSFSVPLKSGQHPDKDRQVDRSISEQRDTEDGKVECGIGAHFRNGRHLGRALGDDDRWDDSGADVLRPCVL